MLLPDVDTKELFAVSECPSCSVMRTLPVPPDLTPYYNHDMGQMMIARPNSVYERIKRVLLRRELRRILRHVRPQAFVDVGSGSGDFAALIHGAGFPVVTVDAGRDAPSATRHLEDVAHCQMNYETYEIRELDTGKDRVVILRHVLEHIRDPRRFLRQMIWYGGAYFYVAVPNVGCLERRLLGRFWSLWDPPRHLWHFDAATLRKLFGTLEMELLATGYDTIPSLVPSLYRVVRLRGWPPAVCRLLNPKGALSALSAPLNFLLPGNVLWAVAKVQRSLR